jgi:hypothetical protein
MMPVRVNNAAGESPVALFLYMENQLLSQLDER